MKKVSKLEKEFVNFLKNEVCEFDKEQNAALKDVFDLHKSGVINSDTVDMMCDDIFRTYNSNIESLLLKGVSRHCSYKSLYSVVRTAYFTDNAANILNNFICRLY